MKYTVLSSALALLLTACSVGTPGMSVGLGVGTGIDRHVGLGTSINFPVRLDKNKNGISSDNGGIKVIEEQIITYFDTHGNTSNSMVKGGYYRQLINKRSGDYIVQDFYSDNGQKRTDPYTLSRNQLMLFRAIPDNGSLTTYAYNGNVMQQQVFKNGKLISAKY